MTTRKTMAKATATMAKATTTATETKATAKTNAEVLPLRQAQGQNDK
jgi:hypothetical protein